MTTDALDAFVRARDPEYVDVGSRFLAELAHVVDGAIVLDIGCGRQTWGEEVYRRARRRVGVDVDDYAKENPLMDEVVITDGKHLPFPDASFDVVTAQWVAEHVQDAETFAGEVMRVLKPGGSFVFMTPNARSPFVIATHFIPTWLRSLLRTKVLGFQHDETFPAYYRLNDARSLQRLFAALGASGVTISYHDTYGYFRFSALLVRVAMVAYRALNRYAFGRQHHMVVLVKKA